MSVPSIRPAARGRNVTAVLGPTNTGKTHLAIERMLGHSSGMIGLPLRLLAREVYQRIADRAGADKVALVTGEEKIVPATAKYFVSTLEAMPRATDVSFVAIDEVQLAGDLERGHNFTDRLLHLRGANETLLLGAATARPLIERLVPDVNVVGRPRMSQLAYAGSRKITRLPHRSAIVAFSAEEVYTIAEFIRRQRGGAAVVMGSLSPRTRNAQVALFQSGDVDYLVATDAIGMGLNLDVDHVAFAQNRKFDGYQFRNLNPGELAQIAGRAGRHLKDGTFGVTGRVDPFEDELVERIESHSFDPVTTFQWRNADLDFATVESLQASLALPPATEGLTRAPPADDLRAFEFAVRDEGVRDRATGRSRVALLWDVAQVPDFQKLAPANHGDLVVTLFGFLAGGGTIPEDWFARQIAEADQADGDLDALAARLAQVRTWTFVANREGWLADALHWQARARDVEDRLSDALHERLTQRFVDRRTSVLMKRLRENAMLEAEINTDGAVLVEGQHVGHLSGFRFVPEQTGDGPDAKAAQAAAAKSLAGEIEKRSERLGRAPNEDIILASDGTLRWLGDPVGRLAGGDAPLSPRVVLLADEQLTGPARDRVQERLDLWMRAHIAAVMKPLVDIREAADLEGIARGVAFRMVENLGTLERQDVAEDVKSLDQNARAAMRRYGARFGAYHIFLPALLKPAPAALLALLWGLRNGGLDQPGLAELPQLSASGRTSIVVDPAFAKPLYRLVGFRVAGPRAIRIDILERLADIIRPLIAWKPVGDAEPPPGAAPEGGGFTVTVAMTSLLGCSGEDFNSILRGLGYRMETRKLPPAPPPAAPEPILVEITAGDTETLAVVADEPLGEGPGGTEPLDPAIEADMTPGDAPPEAALLGGDAGLEQATDEPPAEHAPAAETAPTVEAELPAAEAAPAETAAEPEERTIEVWRPGRSDRGRRPDQRHRAPQARNGEAGEQTRDDRRPGGKRRPDSRPHRPPQAEPGDRPPRADNRPDHRQPRPDHRSGPRPDSRPEHRPAPRPPRPERPIDPTSPFAALAALKADLEERNRKK